MNNCKLIIVEGLPCSGKSTAAKHIADKLSSQGKKVCFVDEGTGNHPADYEFQSFIKGSELKKFTNAEQRIIVENSTLKDDGYIVELSKLLDENIGKNFSQLFNKVHNYKIYDFLDWQTESKLMLDKWQEFSANAGSDNIYVFNCVLLQNPMCETMMRFNFPQEKSFEHISKICDIIKPFNPKVVYLQNDEIANSVKNASAERGEDWLNSVIDYHINGEYGKSKNLIGFNGYIDCLAERQKRELSILQSLNVEYLVVHNIWQSYNNAYKIIDDFIDDYYL